MPDAASLEVEAHRPPWTCTHRDKATVQPLPVGGQQLRQCQAPLQLFLIQKSLLGFGTTRLLNCPTIIGLVATVGIRHVTQATAAGPTPPHIYLPNYTAGAVSHKDLQLLKNKIQLKIRYESDTTSNKI